MSKRITSESLTAALVQNGVIAADATPPPSPPDDRPWFVSALQGTAGWLAGIFVLVFVVAGFEPRASGTYAILAVVSLSVAFALYRLQRNSAFFGQLALAASIAGQLAATMALAIAADSAAIATGGVAVMQCVLVVLMPNRLARSLAAFFACVAWVLTVRFVWWGEEEVWTGTVRHIVSLAPALIGWAVIWIPVAALCVAAIQSEAKWMARPAARIVRPALSGMLFALTFGTFASEPVAAFVWQNPSGSAPQSWLVLWPLLNAGTALFAGFAAFRLRNTALVGVAIVAALLHVGQFYLLLGTTLVVKSIIMVVIGAMLLSGGMFLSRRSAAPGEVAP